MPIPSKPWAEIALSVIRQEAGDDVYAKYEEEFKLIAKRQEDLRKKIGVARVAKDDAKEQEYRAAYDRSLLHIRNVIATKDIDLSEDKMEHVIKILRIVFKVLVHVVVG